MKILALLTLVVSHFAFAQVGDPLTVESDTIALWDFDGDLGDVVSDGSGNSIDGQNFGTTNVEVPNLDPVYSLGREVTGPNQFIDFGITAGSSLDFQGATEFSVEAVINISSVSNNQHIIFTTDQVQLMVFGGKLGGFIRTAAGFRGVVFDEPLSLNTNYRVGVHKYNEVLAVSLNGIVVNSLKISEPIVAPSYSSARVTIGGNIFNQYFLGFIDNVRVSSSAKLDLVSPTITKLLPDTYVIEEAKPEFSFSIADSGSGVNLNKVEIYLNDVLQTGLNVSTTSITGKMDDPMSPTKLNEVRVVISDNAGNITSETYRFSFANVGGKTPYENDSDTLALWHMDDFALSLMMDSGSLGFHGHANPTYQSIGLGVFDTARYFQGSTYSFVQIGSIKIPDDKVTFEAWANPFQNESNEEVIISTGQLKVARFNSGHVRVVFDSTRSDQTFETTGLLLPVGELHHLALTWDGSLKNGNLKIYIDGAIAEQFDACVQCDLNPFPSVGTIGSNFNGMLDEIRLSKVVRSSFNIPNSEQRSIDFINLENGKSFDHEYPEFHATLSSTSSITPANVKVELNGAEQPHGANLVVTGSTIDGTLTDALNDGINYIKVSFVDDDGNAKSKTLYLFYVKNNPLSYYSSDSNTVALWNFDRGQEFQDSSGNENHLNNSAFDSIAGVLDNAINVTTSINDLELSGRSFTVDGFVKVVGNYTSQRQVYRMNGAEFDHQLNIVPASGDLQIYLSTPDLTINKVVAGLFPNDGAFHHVATIYDSTRGHAQLLVLIDGEVVQSLNIDRTCDFSGALTMNLGSRNYNELDQFRLSNSARYEFKGKQLADIVTESNVEEGVTFTTPNVDILLNINSSVGISSAGNKVLVNGIEQTDLSLVQTGTNATISGTLNGVVGGTNILKYFVRNVNGFEQSKTTHFYNFEKLAPAPYMSDQDTLVLLKFDETVGTVFADSSSNGYDFSFSSWSLGEAGVFDNAASSLSLGATATIDSQEGLGTYTIEAWLKGNLFNYYKNIFQLGSLLFQRDRYTPHGLIIKYPTSYQFIAPNQYVLADSEWHHYAVVIDEHHPVEQVYLLEDGIVVGSEKVDDLSYLRLGESVSAIVGARLNNSLIDEFRISTKARYELVSDQD